MQLRKECSCLAVDDNHLLESTNLFNKQFKGSPFGEIYLMAICVCQKGDKYLAGGNTHWDEERHNFLLCRKQYNSLYINGLYSQKPSNPRGWRMISWPSYLPKDTGGSWQHVAGGEAVHVCLGGLLYFRKNSLLSFASFKETLDPCSPFPSVHLFLYVFCETGWITGF